MNDYQTRYLAHRQRKAQALALISRRSRRDFSSDPVPLDVSNKLAEFIKAAPSSCDRGGVEAVAYSSRNDKQLLSGLLVGGVGWCHRADTLVLLFADPAAYVAGDEIAYMPYLDAGVMAAYILLGCETLGLAACFINPNIRAEHRAYFEDRFGRKLFCGVVAFGYPFNAEKSHD